MGADDRPFLINVKYQADEEILQTEIWYFDPVSVDVYPEDLSEIASGVKTRLSDELEDLSPNGLIFHSITVTTPEKSGKGPARWIKPYGNIMPGDGTSLYMDSVCANVFVRGTHSQGKPATSVMRWSIVPREKQDKNQLDAGWSADLLSGLKIVFPDTINVGIAALRRCVKSLQVDDIGDPLPLEFVYPTTMDISSRIGVNLTRVGNRPQSNPGKDPAE